METLIFVEQLTPADHDGHLGDGHAPAANATHADHWIGRGYRWNGGTVLTGVRLHEHEHLGLFIRAVDRRKRPDLRLAEVGEGGVRDTEGWLTFTSGIQGDASDAELEPLSVAAMNMAAQIAWLSGRRP